MSDKESEIIDLNIKLKEHDTSKDGLTSKEATERLAKFGLNAIEEKEESRWKILLAGFWGPIPWMVEAAAILSAVIQHWSDFAIISFMLLLNVFIEFMQHGKAQSALAALKNSMALESRVMRDGKWVDIEAAELVPGDIVQIENGDIIPADLITLEGQYVSVDQAALTGESLPVMRHPGEEIYAGTIVKQGSMVCIVDKTGGNTFFGKTATLVSSAGNESHFQNSVMTIGKFLIYGSLILAATIIFKELVISNKSPLDVIEMVLILIVASIPVAMPAVLSVTMALGAFMLSKKKAIVTKLSAIEEMASVDILCSDKTGTLTLNELTLTSPVLYDAKSESELTLIASQACNFNSSDAIENVIMDAVGKEEIAKIKQLDFTPFDPTRKRTEALIDSDEGQYRVLKGAPQIIIDLCDMSDEERAEALGNVNELASRGLRGLGVARSYPENPEKFVLVGILSLYDPPRHDTKHTVDEARARGIDVRMVTGDDLAIGKEISRQLDLRTNMLAASDLFHGELSEDEINEKIENAGGFARVFPEHKYEIVKRLQDMGHVVAMTGDGVNDAPALKQADIGIAVDGATDAARGAADLILTLPGLSVIIDAVEESRKIFQKIISYVKYRVAMTINIMLFVTLSVLFLDFSPLSAVMIVLLALFDDLPIMTIAYDNAGIERFPVKWNLKRVLTLSSILGVVSVAQNFGLMAIAQQLYSTSAPIQTMLFLQLVIAGHLLLFVVRSKNHFWAKPRPAKPLLIAIFGTQILAIIIAKVGFLMAPISWEAIGIVIVYGIVWMFILDIFKAAFEKAADKKEKHAVYTEGLNVPRKEVSIN